MSDSKLQLKINDSSSVYALSIQRLSPGIDQTPADYMEMYSVEEGIELGDIVTTGTTFIETTYGEVIIKLAKSQSTYANNTIGIISNELLAGPNNSIGHNIRDEDNPLPIAMKGRVPVKVNLENGPIEVGDHITTSSAPGIGMKATGGGFTVGVALQAFDGTGAGVDEDGIGMVMVFVNLSYQVLTVGADNIYELDVIVQATNTRLTSLEDRVSLLEIALSADGTVTVAQAGPGPASATTSLTYSEFLSWFTQSLEGLGGTVVNGTLSLTQLIVTNLSVKNIDVQESMVLHSPDGSCFRVSVGDDGIIGSTPVSCDGESIEEETPVVEEPPVEEEPASEPEADTTVPVITLIGETAIELTVDDTYTDEGATALDNIDGDITSNIVTISTVDTATEGSYTVTYNVTDTASNVAIEVTREVTVVE